MYEAPPPGRARFGEFLRTTTFRGPRSGLRQPLLRTTTFSAGAKIELDLGPPEKLVRRSRSYGLLLFSLAANSSSTCPAKDGSQEVTLMHYWQTNDMSILNVVRNYRRAVP